MKKNRKQKFLEQIIRLEPVEFLGICRILKVRLVEEGKTEPRDFIDIFADVLQEYERAPKKKQKELLHIIEEAIRDDSTKDTKESIDKARNVSSM